MTQKINHKKRILVVDDTLLYREIVEKLLLKANFLVTTVDSGERALEVMEKEIFDLILLDVEMPGMKGFEVCQHMHNDIRLQQIPVIFVTSYGQIENKIKGFGFGAQDFVTKPFNNRELLVRIKTHLLLKHKSDIIKNMNHALEEKNKSITESIAYAYYIQQALLPSKKILDKFSLNNFIFYKPKELIGGDFYWFKQFNSKLYIAISDCTGHGVPGALMSVLGISLLNDIMNHNLLIPPNEILNELRHRLLKAFHQGKTVGYNKDGMDMCICLIDLENMKLQYSGANIPLFLIRRNSFNSAIEIVKRSPDKFPIGSHPNFLKNFTNHYIDLCESDKIYIFTDGYTSQFGGEYDKTFKTKQLVDIFSSNFHLDFKELNMLIEKKLSDWKGQKEQTDDILVFGLEVPQRVNNNKENPQYK